MVVKKDCLHRFKLFYNSNKHRLRRPRCCCRKGAETDSSDSKYQTSVLLSTFSPEELRKLKEDGIDEEFIRKQDGIAKFRKLRNKIARATKTKRRDAEPYMLPKIVEAEEPRESDENVKND